LKREGKRKSISKKMLQENESNKVKAKGDKMAEQRADIQA
jgi:hypothetical protein